MMNEETKAALNEFLKKREERIKNMTLAEARRILLDIADQMPSDVCADWIDAIGLGIKAIDILDKIRAEIIEKFDNCSICEWFEDYDYDENDISEYIPVGHISDIIDIIDKYREDGVE